MQKIRVTVGDRHTASLVGAHLLGEIADRAGLSCGYSAAVPWTGERAPGQDRGRLFAQVAVMLAAGGRSVADMAALRDQPELFGDVASGPTIWRALHQIDGSVLGELRSARATAREAAWEAGGAPDQVVLDVDASLVEIHSDNKEGATSHYKGGFGFHPMFCFLDATGEALAGILRSGNAAANSGADQLAVVDNAIAQLPAAYQAGHRPGEGAEAVGHPLLVRADTAGAVRSRAVLRLRKRGLPPRPSRCRALPSPVPELLVLAPVARRGSRRHGGRLSRSELAIGCPATRDDVRYNNAMASVVGAWFVWTLHRRLPHAAGDLLMRARTVTALQSFITVASRAPTVPRLAAWAHQLLSLLQRRWPEAMTPADTYPAFGGRPFE